MAESQFVMGGLFPPTEQSLTIQQLLAKADAVNLDITHIENKGWYIKLSAEHFNLVLKNMMDSIYQVDSTHISTIHNRSYNALKNEMKVVPILMAHADKQNDKKMGERLLELFKMIMMGKVSFFYPLPSASYLLNEEKGNHHYRGGWNCDLGNNC